ncbi:hypothetical protein KM043_014085 [Ampulex compressa]|nr:hypothetical protein KM043_014085 [Ampulex compressa]
MKRTYVSPLEAGIKAIVTPIGAIDNTIHEVRNGVKEIWSQIPVLRKLIPNREEERNMKSMADMLNPFKERIRAIFPGTYWCGDGDIAENENDLGLFYKTDACCRAHDSCQGGIPAGEERDGLINNGIFTRSPCECDRAFYNCLKEARSIVASKIGITYFNVLRPQCFSFECPVENCNRYAGTRLVDDKCLEYNFNCTGVIEAQWFDTEDFFHA